MPKEIEDRTLALAGVIQAAEAVQQVARHGTLDPERTEPLLASVFVTEPGSTAEVYGSAGALAPGLRLLRTQFAERTVRDPELLRYVLALLHLGGKLLKRREMLETVGSGIERARRQREHYPITHDNLLAALADIYLASVSQLTPRIMVSGEQGYLAHEENVNRVRALLLAGIRSAILWHQSGGSRLGLLFSRKAYLAAADRLLVQRP